MAGPRINVFHAFMRKVLKHDAGRLEQVHQGLALAQLLVRHLGEFRLRARRDNQCGLALVGSTSNHPRLADGLHGARAVERRDGRGSHVRRWAS